MLMKDEILKLIEPLVTALPLEHAMTALVPKQRCEAQVPLVRELVKHDLIKEGSPLAAGLWLYVDDLDSSHRISQGLPDATGSFWHGIMHRREGDFNNSRYWFHRTGNHPAMSAIENYDPMGFIDDAEARWQQSPADLIALQQREWQALFEWCCETD
jgi:hypothetical protein